MSDFDALLILNALLAAAALWLVMRGQLTITRRPRKGAATAKPTGES